MLLRGPMILQKLKYPEAIVLIFSVDKDFGIKGSGVGKEHKPLLIYYFF